MTEKSSAEVLSGLGITTAAPPAGGEGQAGGQEGHQQTQTGLPEGFAPTIFGEGFDSWEKVQTEIPQRLSRLSELEREIEGYKSKPIPEFADPEIASYNEFVRNTGIKDFALFDKVKGYESLDDVEKMVLKEVLLNPEFKGKEDLLRNEILDKYKLSEIYEESQQQLGKVRLQADTKDAVSKIAEIVAKMQVQAPDPEKVKASQQQKLESWLKELDGILGKVGTLPIPIPDGDKFSFLKEFQFKPEVLQQYKEPLAKAVAALDIDDNNRAAIERRIKADAVFDNLPYIIQHVTQLKEAELAAFYENKYGGGLERPKPPGSGGSGGTGDIVDEILKKAKENGY